MSHNAGIRVAREVGNSLEIVDSAFLFNYRIHFRNHFEKYKTCSIGIAMKRSAGFVGAVLEMLSLQIPFVYLHCDPLKYAWTMAERFRVSAIISDCLLEGSAVAEKIEIFDECFYFYDLNFCPLSDLFDTRGLVFAYGTQTSGTTGEPKTVYVPWKCIDTNVQDMKQTFMDKNNGERYIFWGTHPSFDPSILELLLAIESGATLIIPTANWDISDSIPAYLNSISIDFMQTTPTKLMMMSKEKIEWIFQKDSPVKSLIIGGEAFPVAFLNRFVTPQTTVKLYNIYGVTEVSCWAAISLPIEFPRESVETSIGLNLGYTIVEVEDDGKVFIKSKIRECVVNFEWNGENHFTGDYGYVKNEEIFISGRATQKTKGLKPSNEVQEYILKKYAVEFNIIYVFKSEIPSALTIVVIHSTHQLEAIENCVKKDISNAFPSRLQPSRIFAIFNDQLKTTQNGKIDIESFLYKRISQQTSLQFLSDFQIDISLPSETPLHTLGIDSLRYLEIASVIQPIFSKVFPSILDLLNHIRLPSFTLGDLLRFVFLNHENNAGIECENIFIQESKFIELEQQSFKTDACVEVPVVEFGVKEKFYVICSFAGDVYTLKTDGTVLDKKYLGSPIEIPALNFRNLCCFVASNNGRLCKIKKNGEIDQFLNLSGGIRCPIIFDHQNIYVITTEKILFKIHYLSGKQDSVFINTSCRGTPLLFNKTIFIPGLKEFVIVDQISLDYPIFTDAILWKNMIIGICAPGEIISVTSDGTINHAGFAPPTSETPLILEMNGFDIWCFGGYFQSLLLTKVFCKNSSQIIIEPFKRLVFPNSTGIINIPLKIEESAWVISCHRCHVFMITKQQFESIFDDDEIELKTLKCISTILEPEHSSMVRPAYFSDPLLGRNLFFSTRNDSIVLMNLEDLFCGGDKNGV